MARTEEVVVAGAAEAKMSPTVMLMLMLKLYTAVRERERGERWFGNVSKQVKYEQ